MTIPPGRGLTRPRQLSWLVAAGRNAEGSRQGDTVENYSGASFSGTAGLELPRRGRRGRRQRNNLVHDVQEGVPEKDISTTKKEAEEAVEVDQQDGTAHAARSATAGSTTERPWRIESESMPGRSPWIASSVVDRRGAISVPISILPEPATVASGGFDDQGVSEIASP